MRLLDTCFLIDLQRELRREAEGKATMFLGQHLNEVFAISTVSVAEFLEGFPDEDEGERFLLPFQWLELDGRRAREASRIRRALRQTGRLIGDFDILIAATALSEGIPLVTDNTDHFGRIEGLKMEIY